MESYSRNLDKLTNLKLVPSMFFIEKQLKLSNLKKVFLILFYQKKPKFLDEVLRNYLKNKAGSSGMNCPDVDLFLFPHPSSTVAYFGVILSYFTHSLS